MPISNTLTPNICKQFKETATQLHYENLTKTFTKTETLLYFLPVPEICDRALVKAGISHADSLSQAHLRSVSISSGCLRPVKLHLISRKSHNGFPK